MIYHVIVGRLSTASQLSIFQAVGWWFNEESYWDAIRIVGESLYHKDVPMSAYVIVGKPGWQFLRRVVHVPDYCQHAKFQRCLEATSKTGQSIF